MSSLTDFLRSLPSLPLITADAVTYPLDRAVAEAEALEAVARAAEEIANFGYDAHKAGRLDRALAKLREVRGHG